jgi:hypothetical protein
LIKGLNGGGKGWGLAPAHGSIYVMRPQSPDRGAYIMRGSNGIGPSPWTPRQHVTTANGTGAYPPNLGTRVSLLARGSIHMPDDQEPARTGGPTHNRWSARPHGRLPYDQERAKRGLHPYFIPNGFLLYSLGFYLILAYY